MGKYQKRPYYGNLKEAGRPKNSWRSVIKEAGRSWNELRFLAADRSGKNSQTTYVPKERKNGPYYYYHLIFIILLTCNQKHIFSFTDMLPHHQF